VRGRSRQVKPELWKDEVLWDLSVAMGLPGLVAHVFAGLWPYCDREGRFEWRPRSLKSDILPYWDGDFEAILNVLASKNYIVRYTVCGRDYGYVRTFARHQSVHKNEAPSILPDPLAHGVELPDLSAPVIPGNSPSLPEFSGNFPESPVCSPELLGSSTSSSSSTSTPTRASASGSARAGDSVELVARTYSMPSQEAPQDYLDDALLAGVSKTQAESTWAHYFGAGLPERGVERLNAWMVQRAKERANQTAGAKARADAPRTRHGAFTQVGPPLDASAAQRAYGAKHGVDVDSVIAELTRAGVVDALGVKGAREELTKRLQAEARKKGAIRHVQSA
jgi:hypothetical protein